MFITLPATRTVEEEAAAKGDRDGRVVDSRRFACCVAKSATIENVDPRTRRSALRAPYSTLREKWA